MHYRYLVIALILTASFSSCMPLEKQLTRYPNRFNQSITQGDSLARNGIWIEATASETLVITKYVKGSKEGKSKTLYKNGECTILIYKDNKKNGWAKFYNSQGFLYTQVLYENDKIKQRITSTPSFRP